MKIVGKVLIGIGLLLVASVMGQDDYETHAFLNGKIVVDVVPFWVLAMKMVGGLAIVLAGREVLKKEKGGDRNEYLHLRQ